MAATHRTRQDIPWPWEENEGSGREKDGETDQRAHVNRASIRSGQNPIRRKRFLYTCPLQEKELLFGLYSRIRIPYVFVIADDSEEHLPL